jgi:hypothetical protein
MMARENISPKAIGLLSSHFDGFACLDIEEIHTGSRSGTLTGSRSGTLTGSISGAGAGVSSGTRTRRLSGSPISAIKLSRVVIGHNDLPSSDTYGGGMSDKLEAHPASAVLLTTIHITYPHF